MFGNLSPDIALDALLAALDHAGIGCTAILEAGGTTERLYASQPFAEMMGLDHEQAMRLLPFAQIVERDRERARTILDSLARDRPGGASFETTLVRPDGSEMPVEIRLGSLPLAGGRATFSFLRDRTKNVAMETALRESEERFRLVAESSPDSISITAGGRYVYANPVAMEILGIDSEEELATVNPLARIAPEQLPEMWARRERLERGEKLEPMQFRLAPVRPGAPERVVEASISMGHLGGERAILSYTRDVTERVRLQAELMKHDRLASVGMLAAGVAHELNNPLAALGLQTARLLTIAARDALPAEVKEGLEQIDDAARRMTSIISDLLFMSRPTEQPQAHIDVAGILTSTVALLRAGRPTPRLDLHVEPLPAIEGYASKLGQVFLNILLNAVQAVEGRADARVSVEARVRGDDIEVAVRDDGPGIAPHLIPLVIQPFFTTKPQGTGLGLWISNTLVAQHGGTLDIESAPDGGGTTVRVRLPPRLPAS